MSRRGRLLLGVALACALGAGLAVAALALWRTSIVPDRLPATSGGPLLTPGELGAARTFGRVAALLALGAELATIATAAAYAVLGVRFARESAAGRIGTGMLLAMVGFALIWLTRLPFTVAGLWWARDHDVSRQGYVSAVLGNWLGLGGQFVVVCLAVLVAMALAAPLRGLWWIPGAVVFAALALLVTFVQPYLLTDTTPLRSPGLVAAAGRIAEQERLPAIPIVVENVHTQTAAPNAEAVGLGPSRRVVLWDTLLDGRFDDRQVRFVLAHELGHHARRHLWKAVGWYALFALPLTGAIALATRRRGSMYEPAAVPVALLVFVAAGFLLQPLQNLVTRHMEAEADWSALRTTRDPAAARSALVELGRSSLAEPDPPTWEYVLFATHPTIAQRVGMTRAWESLHGQ